MVLVKTAPFGLVNQARLARAGMVDTCPPNCFAFLDMAATIRVGPGFAASNFKCESLFGMMGKGGHFTYSRSVGALGNLYFVCVEFLKILETRRCLNMHRLG